MKCIKSNKIENLINSLKISKYFFSWNSLYRTLCFLFRFKLVPFCNLPPRAVLDLLPVVESTPLAAIPS